MTSIRTLAALAVCLTLPALGAAQGLGAAAARERQRRAPGQKTAESKTYTEEDLKSLPPVEDPGASSGPNDTSSMTPGTAPKSAPTGSSQTEGSDREEVERTQAEARWRSRADAARARVDEARRQLEYFEGLNLVPGVRYVDEKGQTVIGSVRELQGLTRRARAELAAAEKALEDLQDEARRAGVPPGWLR